MSSTQNLVMYQGATYSEEFSAISDSGSPYDLTGATIASSMKTNYQTEASFDFTVAIDATPTTGLFTLSMTSSETALIPEGRYVYDIKMTLDGIVSPILSGIISVTPRVTA